MVLGFGPRYRSPLQREDIDDTEYGRARPPRGAERKEMDLGTKTIIFAVLALVLSWMPLLNIIGFVAALIAIAFGLVCHSNSPNYAEINRRHARIGLAIAVVALIVSVVSSLLILKANPI